tara:strand:+ start:2170 stop:2634 length:465 start_codon:yes stop_codon:yes gene_type:complete
MKNIINTTDIRTVDIINNDHYQATPGKFRFITKCRAGYFSCNDARDFDDARLYANPASVMSAYKKGALHSVEYKPAGSDNFFTVFAKKGNKVILMDEAIMRGLDVGCINQLWFNTNLMDMNQYKAVNSKTWASMAFVMNEAPVAESTACIQRAS